MIRRSKNPPIYRTLQPSHYGVMQLAREGGRTRAVVGAASAPNARTLSTARLLRRLVVGQPWWERGRDGTLLFAQYNDMAHSPLGSVAYGREVGRTPLVRLIVDPLFHDADGYAELRRAAQDGTLPPWIERSPVVFWRGSATNNATDAHGEVIRTLEQIPRVALCLTLRDDPRADVGVMSGWNNQIDGEDVAVLLERAAIAKSGRPMIAHANYRHLIDIDGVANAWSLIEKLLLGACVLKVASPFEQWFYDRLLPWRHYVPVRADLTDLDERIEHCLTHPDEAQAIAHEGQALALTLTLGQAEAEARSALAACVIHRGARQFPGNAG